MSACGIELIKHFEGLRLTTYTCAGGYRTVGWGHKLRASELMGLSDIAIVEAERFLAADLKEHELAVLRLTNGIELTQGQFDALVSFSFNLGPSALERSTLLRLLRVGDLKGAASEFGKWTKAKDIVLHGLVLRRAAETELFLTGRWSPEAPKRRVS